MDLISALKKDFVEFADEGERTDEIRRQIFGVVKEVGDCCLSVGVWRRFSSKNFKLSSHTSPSHTASRPGR